MCVYGCVFCELFNSIFELLILVRTQILKYRTFSNKIVEVSNLFEQHF